MKPAREADIRLLVRHLTAGSRPPRLHKATDAGGVPHVPSAAQRQKPSIYKCNCIHTYLYFVFDLSLKHFGTRQSTESLEREPSKGLIRNAPHRRATANR